MSERDWDHLAREAYVARWTSSFLADTPFPWERLTEHHRASWVAAVKRVAELLLTDDV
jgi:hypothetical protein